MKAAMFAELSAILLWALGNIFVTYLSTFFDNYTQNLFRYLSAAAILLFLSLFLNKDNYLKSFKKLKKLLIPIIAVYMFQILMVYGLVFTTPTIGALITRLSIIFVDIMSFFLFPEERVSISSRGFIAGTLMSFLGVSGVVVTGSSLFRYEGSFLTGVAFLLLASILWAVYTVSVKIALRDSDPLSATVNIFLFSGIMYLPLSMLTGGMYRVFNAGSTVNLLLIASGILAIGFANLLNYYAIQRLGASLPANLQILLPVFTAILSVTVFQEEMPPHKIFFSILTLVGCWLIVKTSAKTGANF